MKRRDLRKVLKEVSERFSQVDIEGKMFQAEERATCVKTLMKSSMPGSGNNCKEVSGLKPSGCGSMWRSNCYVGTCRPLEELFKNSLMIFNKSNSLITITHVKKLNCQSIQKSFHVPSLRLNLLSPETIHYPTTFRNHFLTFCYSSIT